MKVLLTTATLILCLCAALARGDDRQAYEEAAAPYGAQRWADAAASLRAFADTHPASEYLDDALCLRFQALSKAGDGPEALEALGELKAKCPASPLREKLVFYLTGQSCSKLAREGDLAGAREQLARFRGQFAQSRFAYQMHWMEANYLKSEAELLQKAGKTQEAQARRSEAAAQREAALAAITALLARPSAGGDADAEGGADAELKASARANRMHLYYECGKFAEMLAEAQSRLATVGQASSLSTSSQSAAQLESERATLLVWQGVAKACQKPRDLEGAKQSFDAAIAADTQIRSARPQEGRSIPAGSPLLSADYADCITNALSWRIWIAREEKDTARARECLALLRSAMPESNARTKTLERFAALEAQ